MKRVIDRPNDPKPSVITKSYSTIFQTLDFLSYHNGRSVSLLISISYNVILPISSFLLSFYFLIFSFIQVVRSHNHGSLLISFSFFSFLFSFFLFFFFYLSSQIVSAILNGKNLGKNSCSSHRHVRNSILERIAPSNFTVLPQYCL